jgi:xylulokinase
VAGALFLGLDVGSSSTKGVLVRADGGLEASAELPHGISRPRPGWAEHDAEQDWWGSTLEVCGRLIEGRSQRVAAVGLSGLGPCLLPTDSLGRPLRPAILYGIDTRARAQIARLTAELGASEILARCGAQLTSQSVGPKLRWLVEEEPAVWAATRRAFGTASYLVYRLTGEYVLDHHSASHWAPLYNVQRNGWIQKWVDRVVPGLPLPRLVWPQEACGRVTRAAAEVTGLSEGTPVTAGTIDSWAEVVASGLRGPGEGLLVYGTSMFLVEVDSPARPDRRLWTTVGFRPGSRNVAAGVASAGALTDWLRRLTGGPLYDELYEEGAAAGPGAGGLLALPYFAGERTPLFDPDLRGALFGLTTVHGRGHMFRALLEASAFAVRHNLETMREAGATVRSLRSSGGGTSHLLWPQIVSDVTGLAQDVRGSASGGSVGAALLAAVAVGAATLETEWQQKGIHVVPQEELRPLYDELFERFRELTQVTAPQAHALAAWQADRDGPQEQADRQPAPGRDATGRPEEGETS